MDQLNALKYELKLNEFIENINKKPWESIKDVEDVKDLIKSTSFEMLDDVSILENVVMSRLHDKIFPLICKKYEKDDETIYKKCRELSELKVTANQLGASEDFAIPLPATVVELASLDLHQTPLEKLTCLSTAFDLAMAELKGAIVNVIATNSDNTIPTLNISEITPILTTIIIHTKPIHFISNLYYVQNFHWTHPTPTESECLTAFTTAIEKLKVVTKDSLLPQSERVYCDLGLEDIYKINIELDHKISTPINPLERHVENFTNLISASTLYK